MIGFKQIELRRGSKLLFEDATFQVHAGQRLGIIGINGSGKSSLFALLLGQLEHDAGELQLDPGDVIAHVAQTSPSYAGPALDFVLDGDAYLRNLQDEIARLQSTDVNAERLHTLYDEMDKIDGFTATARAARLLHGLGFAASDTAKPVNEFSGGWRMRLNLAQALMCRSDVLLLDEPTNHLDLPAIIWLERWLKAYTGILLLISHDRDFLDGVCTHIAHIERQSVKTYSGNYSQFEAVRAEQLALQQALYLKQQKEVRHIQGFVDRFRYKASKARQAQSRLKMLERMTRIAPAHVDSGFHFRFYEPEKQPQQLIRLEDADLGYEQLVLEKVQFRLNAGDRIGLLGANGAGKSTLIKALVDGSTLLGGERDINRNTRCGYFAQLQLDRLRMDCSPLWHVRRLAGNLSEQDLRNHLGRFGFSGERIEEPVAPFSGGEKARLVLALLVLERPNLLLLDEPTNHLDLEMRHALSLALVEYSGALLVISHDRHLLRSVCDELYVVHQGRLLVFKQSLDDYPKWLRTNDRNGPVTTAGPSRQPPTTQAVSKKQNRQTEAKRRASLKPLGDRVKKIEKEMHQLRSDMTLTETKLHDTSLYSDAARKQEMTSLMQQQTAYKAALGTLEWEWLEASEALEKAAENL